MRIFKFILLASFLFMASTVTFAQNPLNGQDLSQVKADALTETQITQIKSELSKRGLTIDQVEGQAIGKGMSPSEFAKLKERVNNPVSFAKKATNNAAAKTTTKQGASNTKDTSGVSYNYEINTLVYGSELFAKSGNGNTVNKSLATPINYEVGPNDVLKLVVYGVQEYSNDLTVSKEGRISIENVGQVKVSGLTIEAATARIKQLMSGSAYPSLRSGESKLALTVGDIRTIYVNVIGAYKSGTYNVSSLSNVISVLSEAGGPSAIGSYREIEVIRNNKVVAKCDLYKFLQNGDQSQNIGLKDNDVLRVPPYKSRMEIQGR